MRRWRNSGLSSGYATCVIGGGGGGYHMCDWWGWVGEVRGGDPRSMQHVYVLLLTQDVVKFGQFGV